jgi:hypothetical protein
VRVVTAAGAAGDREAGEPRKKPVGATGFPKAESYQRDRADAARDAPISPRSHAKNRHAA